MKKYTLELPIFRAFATLILFGTPAFDLPFVEHSQSLSFSRVLPIASSASCMTWRTTIPTSGFGISGEIIILTLSQLSVIAVMILMASFILSFRGELNLNTIPGG